MINCPPMFRRRSIRACLLLLLSVGCLRTSSFADSPVGSAPPTSAGQANVATSPRLRYRVAVDQGKINSIQETQWNLPTDVGDGIQAQLVDKLNKSGYFIVEEREQTSVDQAANEDQLDAQKQASLPAGATMPVRQKRTAAGYIITPTVIGENTTGGGNHGFSWGGISVGGAKLETTITLNINISDAQSGDVIDTESAVGSASTKAQAISGNFGNLGFNNASFQSSPAGQAVDNALDSAVSKIVAYLSQQPWQARVAAKDPNTGRVIINAGDLAGVAIGQVFDVYEAGQPILDPDTGAVISQGDETLVGHIKVARTEPNAAYCDIVDGKGYKPRDIVKIAP